MPLCSLDLFARKQHAQGRYTKKRALSVRRLFFFLLSGWWWVWVGYELDQTGLDSDLYLYSDWACPISQIRAQARIPGRRKDKWKVVSVSLSSPFISSCESSIELAELASGRPLSLCIAASVIRTDARYNTIYNCCLSYPHSRRDITTFLRIALLYSVEIFDSTCKRHACAHFSTLRAPK